VSRAAARIERARSCEAPAGVAAGLVEVIEGELVVDDVGEGSGVAGEPDRVLAELLAPVVEEGFEPAGSGEQRRLASLEPTPFLLAMQGASYCEYPMKIGGPGLAVGPDAGLLRANLECNRQAALPRIGQAVCVLPAVIIVECDYGAVWPTWTPTRHRRRRKSWRTAHVPFDEVAMPESLRGRLLGWQCWWEEMVWAPDAEDVVIDEDEWQRFLSEGRSLVEELQRELGSAVEVRLGFDSA
jgi:hypothetical protein